MDRIAPRSRSKSQDQGLEKTGALKRIIVTGANGVGKSHFAARLAAARPDVPLFSFDALKLTTQWQQRPRAEIDAALGARIAAPVWILEGGPSLLAQASAVAEALIWLDPPEYLRAWRLAMRPWTSRGQSRPELPAGNVDWPLQQYRFAIKSLRKRRQFRRYITEAIENAEGCETWHCRNAHDQDAVLRRWTGQT